MSAMFFYGTLCHAPLLEAVLGVASGALARRLVPATLADHAVFWVQDQPYPVITHMPGARAQGVVLSAVSTAEQDRLSYYEGAFAYELRDVCVIRSDGTTAAHCYFPTSQDEPLGAHWDLDAWVAQWGDMAIGAARDVMARVARYDARDAARLRPFYMARHWTRQMARGSAAPATLRHAQCPGDVRVHHQTGGYRGFFELAEFQFDHRRFDGSRSASITREVFIAYDAALVLPYDPVTDQVLLVEQLRFGPLWREDPEPWVFEPIAGLVDAGEEPEEAARREAMEESGLTLGTLEPIAKTYAAPGYSTEFFHCFLGCTDLAGFDASSGGLASENEDIRSHVLSFVQAMALVKTGEINAGPLVMMLYWLAFERDRLRGCA